jgi:hypothetical protein
MEIFYCEGVLSVDKRIIKYEYFAKFFKSFPIEIDCYPISTVYAASKRITSIEIL